MRSRSIGSGFPLMLLVAAALWLGTTPFTVAHSTTFTTICTLASSTCGGGSGGGFYPEGGLVADGSGNLYGTTSNGGTHGAGTIFELTPNGATYAYTVLHNFCPGTTCCPSMTDDSCQDGQTPLGNLIMDVYGNLYGTTAQGGPNTGPDSSRAGIVFKLQHPASGTNWTIHRLHNFCSAVTSGVCSDGEFPMSGLSYKPTSSSPYYNGTDPLYGTTYVGGQYTPGNYGGGALFKLTPGSTWTETVVHSFGDPSVGNGTFVDGFFPVAGVTLDSSGNIFGTTSGGGLNNAYGGVIFKIDTSNNYGLLYEFCETTPPNSSLCTDGRYPNANLTLDSNGNIFGTTLAGSTDPNQGSQGVGLVFKLPSGSSNVTVLYSFCAGLSTCTDGNQPAPGSGLILSSTGDIYGTTKYGGNGVGSVGGEVYKLHPSGGSYTMSWSHGFCQTQGCNNSPSDGDQPVTGLTQDAAGNMYGTTYYGGTSNGGTIYKVAEP